MKKTVSIVLLLIAISSFSQSTENLKTSLKKLYEANYLMDFETIATYSYPKIVDTFGSEITLEKLEKHYENEEYRLRLQLETVPFLFGPIKKLEEKYFCVITFRNPMRYTFEIKLTAETALVKSEWLKESNNTKEVIFEPKRNSFNVRKKTTIVAVADETTTNQWKFFNLDDAFQNESFLSIFGESFKKELGL
jgi:hypothetical protein